MPSSNARSPSLLLPWLAAGLLLVALPLAAGEVYQWKDAKGVTHYSDSPPPNQAHKSRSITAHGSAATAVAAKPAAVNSDCSNARANLSILQGKDEVGIDENNDGKADRKFTAAERASRIQLAEASIRTYCEVALASDA